MTRAQTPGAEWAPNLCAYRFGRAHKDDVQLLAPLFQCCVVRASTFVKLIRFLAAGEGAGAGGSLSAAMRASLGDDAIAGVLNRAHLSALNRRVGLIALVVRDCIDRRSRDPSRVVIDDGF